MNRKHLVVFAISASLAIAACQNNEKKAPETANAPILKEPGEDTANKPVVTDESRGLGKFTEVKLTHPLDAALVKAGQSIYDVKCASCHKLNSEKLVGPGWGGVTDRRKPEWIMNFVTNTEEMIEKNPEAQKMLEVCMVRMPNQNLKDEEARQVLEFMRKNDNKN